MRLSNVNPNGSIGLQLFNDYRRYTLFAGQSINVEGGKEAENYYRNNYGPIGVVVTVDEETQVEIVALEPEPVEVPAVELPADEVPADIEDIKPEDEVIEKTEEVPPVKEEVVVEEKKTPKKSQKKQQK